MQVISATSYESSCFCYTEFAQTSIRLKSVLLQYEYLSYFLRKMAYPNKVAEFSADAATSLLVTSTFGKIHLRTEFYLSVDNCMHVTLCTFTAEKLRIALAFRNETFNDTPFIIGHCSRHLFVKVFVIYCCFQRKVCLLINPLRTRPICAI